MKIDAVASSNLPNTCLNFVKNQDGFETTFNMRLTRTHTTVSTLLGSLCTLVLVVLVSLYSYECVTTLVTENGDTINQNVIQNHFSEFEEFSHEKHGLNIAVAFTSYGNVDEWELDPSYGEIVI